MKAFPMHFSANINSSSSMYRIPVDLWAQTKVNTHLVLYGCIIVDASPVQKHRNFHVRICCLLNAWTTLNGSETLERMRVYQKGFTITIWSLWQHGCSWLLQCGFHTNRSSGRGSLRAGFCRAGSQQLSLRLCERFSISLGKSRGNIP